MSRGKKGASEGGGSERRRGEGKLSSIGDILKSLEAGSPLGLNLDQAKIWEKWPEVAGPRLFAHGAPVRIKDGTLYIEAESPVWMHRFAFAKWQIVGRINKLAGKEIVTDVFVRLEEEDEGEDGG